MHSPPCERLHAAKCHDLRHFVDKRTDIWRQRNQSTDLDQLEQRDNLRAFVVCVMARTIANLELALVEERMRHDTGLETDIGVVRLGSSRKIV